MTNVKSSQRELRLKFNKVKPYYKYDQMPSNRIVKLSSVNIFHASDSESVLVGQNALTYPFAVIRQILTTVCMAFSILWMETNS